MASNDPAVMRRTDLIHLDPKQIIVQEGWNPRRDFGDMEALKQSIISEGVQVPIRVRKTEQGYVLVNGNRRLNAVLQAIAEGHDIKSIPAQAERKGVSDVEAFFHSITDNDAKPFTPIEEARAYNQLRNWGVSVEDIARRTGRTPAVIYQRLKLVDAAPDVQAAVEAGDITQSQAREIVDASGGSIEAQRGALAEAKEKRIETREEGKAKAKATREAKKAGKGKKGKSAPDADTSSDDSDFSPFSPSGETGDEFSMASSSPREESPSASNEDPEKKPRAAGGGLRTGPERKVVFDPKEPRPQTLAALKAEFAELVEEIESGSFDIAVTEIQASGKALAAAFTLGRLAALAHACDLPLPETFRPTVEALAALE